MMFTLESMLEISGDVNDADQLEKIAFNASPTQISDDFLTHQYFQQANQVMITRGLRNFDQNHGGTDLCYSLLTGIHVVLLICTEGWPKFTQNLFYASADNGVAALVYSTSGVTALVADHKEIVIKEETNYPFDETIRFTISFSRNEKDVTFPLHLRIPAWCKKAVININGKENKEVVGNQIVKINRSWKNGNVVELRLPMHIFREKWHENSVSVQRGPVDLCIKNGGRKKKSNK